MTRFEVLLLALVAMAVSGVGGVLYGSATLDVARVEQIRECQLRGDILTDALEGITGSKLKKWDFIYDAAKKRERKQP